MIHLKNCFLIPSISLELLSFNQLTNEFNCTVLMISDGCIVQDGQTRMINGHGTEKVGLYYVEEAVHKVYTSLAHRSSNHQLWMWHRRVGHPSLWYLKRLFSSFCNCNTSFNCEYCVLAKSHKHSYTHSLTHSIKPFVLIHSDVRVMLPNVILMVSYIILFVDDCTWMS